MRTRHPVLLSSSLFHFTGSCWGTLIPTCAMTHSSVRNDSFTMNPLITDICAMSHSSVRHDSFAMNPPSLIYVPCLIHLCAMTPSPWILHHSYMGQDSFICAPWLIRHKSSIPHICARLIHLCAMTHSPWILHHSYMCHDSFICAPWLIRHGSSITHIWAMTHSSVRQDSFMRAATHSYMRYDTCMCTMNHSSIIMCHDPFMCAITHSPAPHDSIIHA